MSLKEDLLRAYSYGSTEYYRALQKLPSYQKELERTRTDYNGRSWIQSPFKLPRFTDDEFEIRRKNYQAKYGTKIEIPGLGDIFHLKIPVKISVEEMAAHRLAIRKGLPSPLTKDQQQSLVGRKYRFLKSLAAATPEWLRNYGSVATFLDNSEDALVTAAVLGRLTRLIMPKIWFKLVPGLGWVLLGADIINTFNIFSVLSFSAMGKKRIMEDLTKKNPFHSKAWAHRATKLYRVVPSVGEMLEVAQTTDQIFGIGLCLGGIVGAVNQVMQAGMETIAEYGAKTAVTVQHLSAWETIWADQLLGAAALLSGTGSMIKRNIEETIFVAESALHGLMPWWFKNDPLKEFYKIGDYHIRPPKSTNPATRSMLIDAGIDPDKTSNWPILNKPTATIGELLYAYSPRIKDTVQQYWLSNKNDLNALYAGQKAVDFHEGIVSMMSNDGSVLKKQTAYSQAAKEMSRDVLLIPPDTPQELINALADWINNYERTFADTPSVKSIELQGNLIGIKWSRSFPRITFEKAAEAFPEWKAIQDLIPQIFVAD